MMYNLILIATQRHLRLLFMHLVHFFYNRDLLGSCCSSQTSQFVERGRNNIVLRLRPLSSQILAAASKAFSKGSLSLCGKLQETAAEENIFFHRSRQIDFGLVQAKHWRQHSGTEKVFCILCVDNVSFSLHSCSKKTHPYWHTQLQLHHYEIQFETSTCKKVFITFLKIMS